jgi:myo-inositol 2-dehydrogenase / D-chiro-inositol 1-dehydrogenase
MEGNHVSRREFLATSGAIAAASAFAPGLLLKGSAEASAPIRVGLVGCGGRGTGAAINAAKADASVRIVAVADLFADKVEKSLSWMRSELGAQVDISARSTFLGFDACERLLASGVDLVILATPPHFRPAHIEASIAAGKHVFAEKAFAVDVPGLKRVQAAAELARRKGLSLVAGLPYRYEFSKRETVARIHQGAIGEIRHLYCSYNKGLWDYFPRQAGWSDMELQIRNYPHYLWLQGDIVVDLLVHNLDKVTWMMKGELPVRAWGMGGKEVATVGAGFDHHAIVYEYASGVRLTAYARAIQNAQFEVGDFAYGTEGTASLMDARISGRSSWQYSGPGNDMYQTQLDEMIAGIRSGRVINDGELMVNSNLLAIMGRWASYTGKVVTRDQVWGSRQVLGPAAYELGPVPEEKRAVPGRTQLS